MLDVQPLKNCLSHGAPFEILGNFHFLYLPLSGLLLSKAWLQANFY